MGSSSLTRNRIWNPCTGSTVLASGPPRKTHQLPSFESYTPRAVLDRARTKKPAPPTAPPTAPPKAHRPDPAHRSAPPTAHRPAPPRPLSRPAPPPLAPRSSSCALTLSPTPSQTLCSPSLRSSFPPSSFLQTELSHFF